MRKFFIILALFVFISPCHGELNYDLLYKDTPILDYMYETGVDEREDQDYQQYIISPYVLVRLPAKLRNKNIVLKPGYYLVKPENKDGYRYAIFKQNGRVIGSVPIYHKSWINPETTFPKPPEPKHLWYTQPFFTTKKIVGWPFKKVLEHRKPFLPPRAKADFQLTDDGKYYDMWLYVEDSLYKMLFKLEN
ncbi:MAG: hypothetical protein A2Y25_06710 [Candidatus Melainabacteria bacterium GWF2_37_15]|nr:MAG: hypothetical protein A2Y25_06710 [Candidatus Melainabacteria bacterium GWF2_37_15]